MKPAHPSDDGPVLDVHVPCVRCSYDLAGAHVFGKCPECGLEVLASVAHNADPEVAHLATPETPRAASTAVIALTVAPLLVMLRLLTPLLLRLLQWLCCRERGAFWGCKSAP